MHVVTFLFPADDLPHRSAFKTLSRT